MITHTTQPTARPPTFAVLSGTAAITGQVILLLSAWLLPAVSEYDLTRDYISELALGLFGWIQTAAFALSGLGVVALAIALDRDELSGRGSRLGPILIAIYGSGAILSALFPTDPVDGPPDFGSMTTTGLVHVTVAAVSFLSALAAMLLLSRTFSRDPRWRAIWPWSLTLAIVALPAFLVSGTGLGQRLLVTVIAAWIVLVAQRLRSTATHAVLSRKALSRKALSRKAPPQ